MPIGNKIIESKILNNIIDISDNLPVFKIKNNINTFIEIDLSTNEIILGPKVNINLLPATDGFIVGDSSFNYIVVDSSVSELYLGPSVNIILQDNLNGLQVKNDINTFIHVDPSANEIILGPKININLLPSTEGFIVGDLSFNYIIVDSSASELYLENLSVINLNKSQNIIDIKINNTTIQKDYFINGYLNNLSVNQNNIILTISSFIEAPNNLIEINTVLKANNINNNNYSIINKKIIAYNYLNNIQSTEILNLFDQQISDLVFGQINFDISLNNLFTSMDLSGTFTKSFDISFNITIKNIFI